MEYILGEIKKFIDIGANDGISVSNTFLFALKGARGLSFEPVKKIYRQLTSLYSFNSKIKCFQIGLSDRKGFLEIRQDGLLSSFVETEDIGCKKLLDKYSNKNASIDKVPIDTLQNILVQYSEFKEVDFVSLDVEGHELNVLKGIDFSNFNTKCFVIETHGKNQESDWLHKDYQLIDDLLVKNHYQVAFKNFNNTFWVNQDYLNKISFEDLQLFLDKNKITGYELIFQKQNI